MRGDVGGRSFALGLLAGVGGGAGLAAFYRALSLGTMSVVSPVVACGAVVPFAISVATGERPSVIAFVRRSRSRSAARCSHRSRSVARPSPERARAVALALVAAAALGLFVYFLGLGSREGDALSTLRRCARRLARGFSSSLAAADPCVAPSPAAGSCRSRCGRARGRDRERAVRIRSRARPARRSSRCSARSTRSSPSSSRTCCSASD